MKTKIAEVKDTFDNDNYIQENDDGTFTVATGPNVETYQTEEEAVADWVEVSNDWDQSYYADTLHGSINADLTDKAKIAFNETSPLNIIEHRYDCEYNYSLRGCIVMDGLTENELNEVLEDLYDQAHLEEEK